MLPYVPAEEAVTESVPPPTPQGCAQCAEKREALIAKAIARLKQHQQTPVVTFTTMSMATPEEMVKHEIVEGRPRHYCEGCGRRIPKYEGMQNAGFQSHTIHHYHGEPIDMINPDTRDPKHVALALPVHLELCHECYLQDFAKVYPGEPLHDIANVRFD